MIGKTCSKLMLWYRRRTEAEALSRIRRLSNLRERDLIKKLKIRFLEEQFYRDRGVIRSLFESIVAYVLPENRKGVICKYFAKNERSYPVGYVVPYLKDGGFDSLTKELQEQIQNNPNKLSTEKLQELRAVQHVVTQSKSDVVIATLSSYLILDHDNQRIDEWDGVIIEIHGRGVRVTIVEAKDLQSSEKNENESYKQLGKTRSMLRGRHKFKTHRYKIPDIGAALVFEFK